MRTANVYFNDIVGRVKPMHAVNNGPVYKWSPGQRNTNIDLYRAAGIPYARNHDASLYSTYGGEHTVDVHAIFPRFEADPYDPLSYDFVCTDEYIRVTELAGTRTFYRLGSKIEHGIKKYGTLPPPDFKKWAVICEHIIRHYTEGWADGFHYDIEYWEIWNEPDLDPPTWGGTKEQFIELYNTASTHLKHCFPHLKIGGPALGYRLDWLADFLDAIVTKPDFLSWHCYGSQVAHMLQRTQDIRRMLDERGMTDVPSILNEWNYVKGWDGDIFYYSKKCIKGLKGAAFTAAVMCACQYAPVDMLMYYDARPGAFNGLFDTDFVCDPLKGYYPFPMFNTLYRLGNAVRVRGDEDLYLAAAVGQEGKAILLSYYTDDDTAQDIDVTIHMNGLSEHTNAEIYLLDATHDMQHIRTEAVTDTLTLSLARHASVLVTLA